MRRKDTSFTKKIALLICFCLAGMLCGAQSRTTKQLSISPGTVFKDQDGKRISFEEFNRLTSAPGYQMVPTLIEGDEVKEVMVTRPSIAADVPPPMPLANAVAQSAGRSGEAAHPFALNDLNGKRFDLNELRGRVVVLKFWFTTCAPCVKEMPRLNSLVEQYKNDPNVVFLAPCLDDAATAAAFLRRQRFAYHVLPNARSMAEQYRIYGYPTHVVIGRGGDIKALFSGVNEAIDQVLDNAIQKELLGENEVDNISSNDLIKDERGNVLDYPTFIQMANSGLYAPVRRQAPSGERYILMKRR